MVLEEVQAEGVLPEALDVINAEKKVIFLENVHRAEVAEAVEADPVHAINAEKKAIYPVIAHKQVNLIPEEAGTEVNHVLDLVLVTSVVKKATYPVTVHRLVIPEVAAAIEEDVLEAIAAPVINAVRKAI